MNFLLRKFFSILRNEDGQASSEYIILLAVITGFLVMVVKKLIQPMFSKLTRGMSNAIQQNFFATDFHTFRIRR